MKARLRTRISLAGSALALLTTIAVASITYEYDKLNRLRRVTFDDGSVIVYEYDPAGNRTLRITNSNTTLAYLSVYVTPVGWGSFVREPNLDWYPVGSSVSLLSEVAAARFGGWIGDVPLGHERDNPLILTMDGSKVVALEVLYALGDIDTKGGIDLSDHARFILCVGGPGMTDPPPDASPIEFDTADLDRDGDVDLLDFAAFQRIFGGSLQ